MDDLYEVLQIHPRATPEVARAAYRALARMYHPDTGGDGRHMIALNEAWAVLGDPVLRSTYDAKRDRLSGAIEGTPWSNGHGPNGHAGDGHGANAHTVGVDGVDEESGNDLPARGRNDRSTTLDFGRYDGWSLGQLVDADPDYLEWLIRTSIGRRLTAEVEELLAHRAVAGAVAAAVGTPLANRRSR